MWIVYAIEKYTGGDRTFTAHARRAIQEWNKLYVTSRSAKAKHFKR